MSINCCTNCKKGLDTGHQVYYKDGFNRKLCSRCVKKWENSLLEAGFRIDPHQEHFSVKGMNGRRPCI